MSLREQFTEQLKASMKAGDSARTSTLRMILAKLKDTDIAARPKGIDKVPDDEVLAMLRGMVKSRRESVELYEQGNRPELAAKETAEIAVIEGFLPQQMDEAAIDAAVADAVAEAGAAEHQGHGQGHGRAAGETRRRPSTWPRPGAIVKARLSGLITPAPDMALPASFLDELRARTPLPAVIGRRVRLARSGRQWKGCCPFHGEKTPSFYVYDDHYHCFGCGAHGDAITFVMQSQGAVSWKRSSSSPPKPGWRCRNPRPRRRRRSSGGWTSPACWRRPQPVTSAGCCCPRAERPATTCSAAA